MSDLDISVLANSDLTSKISQDPIKYSGNEAVANVILQLDNMGLLETKMPVKPILDRKHSPEVFDALNELADNIKQLKKIARVQKGIFLVSKPNEDKVANIRAAQFKGGR